MRGMARMLALLVAALQWTTYSGDDTGRRHSALAQIAPANVAELRVAWTFDTGVPGKFEATPLTIGARLYTTGPDNHAWAIDAKTGAAVWHYARTLPAGIKPCCGRVNRGLAVYRDMLLFSTLDAHLVALDVKTGAVRYDVAIDDFHKGYTATAAPLVVKDKVVVGIAGAEFGVRGFVDAYDAATGKRAWRFWTVPQPGEPGSETWPEKPSASWVHGGGPTWVTGSYDPALNLVYWGVGNPSPLYFGQGRKGDNLYTNCLLALDADTGRLRWHYQFTPHDLHDWDSNHVPVIADLTIHGAPRKTVLVANRNGFFYALDRATGALLLAKPFIHTTWATEIGPAGRPVLLPNNEPTPEGTLTCPDLFGATNFMSPSFNPALGLFFVTAREACGIYFNREPEYVEGERYEGGGMRRSGDSYGAVRAIDPATGERRWEFRTARPSLAGTLSTASGLVFAGDIDGNIFALDARSGQALWRTKMGAPIYASPMTMMADGKQYVVLGAGTTLTAFALP
jgi:alcohol dehydrogenase (cytochrome c)